MNHVRFECNRAEHSAHMAQHDSWQGATGIHVHVNTTCRMVHDDDPAPPGKVTVRDRYMSF